MPHRVTYIIANVDRAVAFEWVVDLLDRDRFELDFILLNPGPSVLEDELAQREIPCERVTYRGYRVYTRDLPGALWQGDPDPAADPARYRTHAPPSRLHGPEVA